MNKELTIILATKINAYNQKVSDIRKFALSNEELEMFASAMQEYSDQQAKKEAIALFGFAEWASHSDWTYLPSKKLWYNEEDEENVTPKTTDELYKLFNQQK